MSEDRCGGVVWGGPQKFLGGSISRVFKKQSRKREKRQEVKVGICTGTAFYQQLLTIDSIQGLVNYMNCTK